MPLVVRSHSWIQLLVNMAIGNGIKAGHNPKNGHSDGIGKDANTNGFSSYLVNGSANLGETLHCQDRFTDCKTEPLAVVGFSLKFPQEATTPEGFWNMLMNKRCAMTEWPPNRLNINAFYHPDCSRSDSVGRSSPIFNQLL